MPLVKIEQISEDTKLLVWYMTEDCSFFQHHMTRLYPDPFPWEDMKEKRKKEFLASRYLIQLGLPPGLNVSDIIKDVNQCPHFKNPPLYFGISHTKQYIACVISSRRCGCDIERYQDRILKISHRFMTPQELKWAEDANQIKKSHLIWGIKESAFKTWGRKRIDWKRHIKLDSIQWKLPKGNFAGNIGNDLGSVTFQGGYEYFSEVLIVWSVETKF